MKFIVSASVIVLNENDEILLMKGRRGWEMPQGCVEEGETISCYSRGEGRDWH